MSAAAAVAPVETGACDLVGEIAAMAQARTTRSVEHAGAETRLAADLGLRGDAAHAFLDEFAEKYGVHLGMLRFRRFFEEEGFDPLAPALIFWLRRIDRNFALQMRAAEATEREITIAHMARVAEAKTWFDPAVSDQPKPREPRTIYGQMGAGLLSLVPIFLATIMPAMLVLMLGLAVWSGNWSIVERNLWLVAFMGALAGLQAWIARNSWRAIERKLATGAA
jgi:hypothetical protein